MASTWPAEIEERRLRLLGWAVLASLVLHALLLSLLPLLREAKRQLPAPPLVARFAKPKPPEPELALPARKVEPQTLKAARPMQETRTVAKPQPAPVPAPILSVEPAKQASEAALSVPAQAAAPAQAVPSLSSPAAKAEASAAQAASGPDAGNVARFRLELMDIARRYKRYPRIAQDNNWEGRVELRIAFGEDGAISSLSVKKGSGRTVLDDEAQAMIRVAKSKVGIPPALRGRAFTLEIPVDFFLKEN